MRIKFWGTRGSIPKPGPDTVKFGGNTSCIEIRSSKGTLVVIDCGTGGYALGQKLLSQEDPHKLKGHILISHTHWDHIQGLPFFGPLFHEGTTWDIYGPQGLSQSIAETLAGQMEYPYFPVNLEQFRAKIRYHDLVEGTFEIDDIRVKTRYLNHTNLTIGYRLEVDGITVVYSSDHEPYSQKLAFGQGEVTGRDRQHAKFLSNAHLVIHDAQYKPEEYQQKVGWGHSTMDYAVKVCKEAGVQKLALTHHDPSRTDGELEKIQKKFKEQLASEGSELEVFVAAEGQEILLDSTVCKVRDKIQEDSSIAVPNKNAMVEQSILIYVPDPSMAEILSEAMQADGIRYKFVPDVKALKLEIGENRHSLMIIEHNPPLLNGIQICSEIKPILEKNGIDLPFYMITANEENLEKAASIGIVDWMIKPFSVSYARSKMRAWILRTLCRWERAPLPSNEKERISSLEKLGILDTAAEERFDKLARITAALLDVPMVLIGFIDSHRHWFKTHYGIDLNEISRENSFCNHIVYSKEAMVIPDTLLDDRFADNPLVNKEPYIRFYAGFPLTFDNDKVLGTFCILDRRPRYFNPQELKIVEDIRDLILRELQEVKK